MPIDRSHQLIVPSVALGPLVDKASTSSFCGYTAVFQASPNKGRSSRLVIVSRELYTELRNTEACSEDNKDNKQFNPRCSKTVVCREHV